MHQFFRVRALIRSLLWWDLAVGWHPLKPSKAVIFHIFVLSYEAFLWSFQTCGVTYVHVSLALQSILIAVQHARIFGGSSRHDILSFHINITLVPLSVVMSDLQVLMIVWNLFRFLRWVVFVQVDNRHFSQSTTLCHKALNRCFSKHFFARYLWGVLHILLAMFMKKHLDFVQIQKTYFWISFVIWWLSCLVHIKKPLSYL